MIEILRDKEKRNLFSFEKLCLHEELQSFTVFDGNDALGSCYFKENDNHFEIVGIYFKSADEKRFFFDGLIKAVLNYALLQGKDTVFCENKEYFPDLFLEGFLREENKDKVFSSPEEFFSRKPCEGCSSCKS